jgi:hypothetical protein
VRVAEVAHILGRIFSRFGFQINYEKNGLGYILEDFLTNLFGHPASGNVCSESSAKH